MDRGAHDKAIAEIKDRLRGTTCKAFRAKLFLVQGEALHSKAGAPDGSRDLLKEAHLSAATAVQLFEAIKALDPTELDQSSFADALVLEANLLARLFRFCSDKEAQKTKLDEAKEKAKKAEHILKELECCSKATAIRVLGVIWLTLKDFHKAKQLFLEAIREFRRSSKEVESVWSAVAYWNMHIVQKELREKEKAVPWLKRATMIREHLQGADHPYVVRYHKDLKDLMQELGLKVADNARPEAMSHPEWKEIDDCLGKVS